MLIDILQVGLFLIGFYYFSIALFSLTVSNKERTIDTKHTFALLVAAHNEEGVVGELVKNLKDLDYPKENFQVFVVADNCDDKTAQIARDMGATVFERFDKSKRGKGFAMEYAFERIFAMEENFEYI